MRPAVLLAAVLREARAARGRLAFFTVCLAVGVAAVTGVSALVASVEASLRGGSRELLAADLRVSARRPLPPELDDAFADVPHERTDVVELAALASAEDEGGARSRLVELKVVDGRYPFYGALVLDPPAALGELPRRDESGAEERPDRSETARGAQARKDLDARLSEDGGAPPAEAGRADREVRTGGEVREAARAGPLDVARRLGAHAVWCAPDLLAGLGIEVGDELSIGGARFRVAAAVLDEPDRLDFALALGPRVFLSAEGFARTSLGGPRNRVRYRALFRLFEDRTHDELEALEDAIRAAVPDPSWISISTHTEAQPTVRRALGRVEDYLGLVALLSLLLGGVGVAQVVRAWLAGRTRAVAVMRCVGFRAREIAAVYLGNVLALALGGCLLGGLLGALLPFGVRALAPDLFQGGAVALEPLAVLRGVGLGLFVAALFCLPPLAAVWRVPPAAVLRAEAAPLPAPRAVRVLAPVLLGAGLFVAARAQGGSWAQAGLFTGGLGALAALLWLGARGVMALAGRVPRGRLGATVEHGLAALARPGRGTTGAVVALGLGVLVVVAMQLVESSLSRALREALPEDAPSVFLVDVQPDQWPEVRDALAAEGARSVDAVPVVMARLSAIDGVSIAELSRRGHSRWVLSREQRLTWRSELPPDNVVVAGELWSDPGRDEVSLEEGYAERLGVGLGDTLTFDVQGVPVELVVTSLRTVDWASFAINFFLVVEPGVLDAAPHMVLAAARVEPPARELALQARLAREHPNVTLLRVRPILAKLAALLERIGLGVRMLGAFTIVTGLVILAGAVGASALHRRREAALLGTLGVTRAGVRRLFAVEYALVGLVAGAIGAAGAFVLAALFLEHVLQLSADLSPAAFPLAALATALLATASGLAASRRALRTPPLATLRG